MKQQLKYFSNFFLLLFVSCVVPVENSNTDLMRDFDSYIQTGIKFLDNYDNGSNEDLMKAKVSFEVALEINNNSPVPFDGLACVAIRQKDENLAKMMLQRAIEIDPSYSRAYVNLAYVEMLQGDNHKSEELLKKSIELNKFDPRAINDLASLRYNSNPNEVNRKIAIDSFLKAKLLYGNRLSIIEKNLDVVKEAKFN